MMPKKATNQNKNNPTPLSKAYEIDPIEFKKTLKKLQEKEKEKAPPIPVVFLPND